MNFKKIIKEEMDDLSWMDDVAPNLTIHGLVGFYFKYEPNDKDRKFYITSIERVSDFEVSWEDKGFKVNYVFDDMTDGYDYKLGEFGFVQYVNDGIYQLYNSQGDRIPNEMLIQS